MEYGEEEWGQISSKLCMVCVALGFIYLFVYFKISNSSNNNQIRGNNGNMETMEHEIY